MLRTAILTATLAAAGMAQPALAQSWGIGVGVEYGPPVFYGPPPVYYDPRLGPPPAYYGAPPVVVRRPAPHFRELVPQLVSPDTVLDRLEAAGYREFSPMAHRGGRYKLNAVDPSGDLVALELSTFTGEIESRYVLQTVPRPPALARVRPEPEPDPALEPEPERVRAPAPPEPAVSAAEPLPPRQEPPAPEVAAAEPPPVAPEDAPSSLRDRLIPPPEEPEDGERDPLVVY